MADLRLVATQVRFQLISVARNRRAIVLGAVFPAVLLVMFNSVFGDTGGTERLAGREDHGACLLHGQHDRVRGDRLRVQPARDQGRRAYGVPLSAATLAEVLL